MRVSEVIQFPPKEAQVCTCSNETKQPMLGALFAMDGTLCRLPHRGRDNEFVSRKSQPQINVLVVCDWNKNLVYVEPGFTGKTQDNDMFNKSVLHREMKLPDYPLREGGIPLIPVLSTRLPSRFSVVRRLACVHHRGNQKTP